MADHSKPTNSSLYTNYTTEIDARFDDLAVGLDPAVTTATNIPTNTIRWNSANSYWEKYNGSTWAALDTGYEIDLAGARKITTNSASPALTITQTGAGNAFVVEDSASPEVSPFVIDATGNVVVGNTTPFASGLSTVAQLGIGNIAGTSGAGLSISKFRNSGIVGADIELQKSRISTLNGNVIGANSDLIGTLTWTHADGTSFIPAASIAANIDGTPGTNDMPGRLVFSTTADGSATPTERMRIDSAGQVGIGGAPAAGNSVRISKAITGSTNSISLANRATIQPDVTASATMFDTVPATAANGGTPYTITSLNSYSAGQGTFNADSTVTKQFGFIVQSTLVGATNNYGFFSNIPSGTGRWNFYAAGTADNYFAGKTLIQTPTSVGLPGVDALFEINEGSTRAITIAKSRANSLGPAINIVKSRSATYGERSGVLNNDQVGGFEWWADDGTSLVRAAQIQAQVDGTPGTNNMPCRLIFSTTADGSATPTERMRIDSAGRIGIGGTAPTSRRFALLGNSAPASLSSSIAEEINITVQPDTTASFSGLATTIATASNGATPYTITDVQHYFAGQGTFNADSTVTNQFGYLAQNTLIGATNNYGFFSNIPSGTGRWNFYANGTAANYFNGTTWFGSTAGSTGLSITTSFAGAQSNIIANSATGGQIDLDHAVGDGAGGAAVRLFRATTTTGNGLFQIYLGDGTTSINHTLHSKNNQTSSLCANNGNLNLGNASGKVDVLGSFSTRYVALTAGTTAMGFGVANVVRVTPNATATYTTTVPSAGAIVVLSILTSGTTSYTITFGTGFKSTGTLATGTVSARYFNLTFVSDGTNLIETARTVAIT